MSAYNLLSGMGVVPVLRGGGIALSGIENLTADERQQAISIASGQRESLLAELQGAGGPQPFTEKPLSCSACTCWQSVPGLAWWCGKCACTGRSITTNSTCDRGFMENEPDLEPELADNPNGNAQDAAAQRGLGFPWDEEDGEPHTTQLDPLPMPWAPDTWRGRPCCYLPCVPERLRGILKPDLQGMGIPAGGLPSYLRPISIAGWSVEFEGGNVDSMEAVTVRRVHADARMEDGVRQYLKASMEEVKGDLRLWLGVDAEDKNDKGTVEVTECAY